MDLKYLKNKIPAQEIWKFITERRFYFALGFIILSALILRLEVYFLDREFWHDEVWLAVNFVEKSGFLWAFKHLDYQQVTPPLFIFGTKILTDLFGKSEYIFRIIPFFASLASVFAFLALSLKFLKTKKAIVFANSLFAVNFLLLRYTSEFKQYSSDVLIFILLALLMFKIDFEKFDTKAFLLAGLAFAVLFNISQPTCFFLFGIILFNLVKKRPKALYMAIFPMIAILIYKFSMPKDLNDFMHEGWETGFLSFKTFLPFVKESFEFFHYGQKYLAFASPLCIIGFFIFMFKKEQAAKIVLYSFFGLLVASILRQYPAFGRVVLFLAPILIIFIGTALDFETKKFNKALTILITALALSFPILYGGNFICKNRMALLKPCSPRSALVEIKNEIKKDDFLVVPMYLKPYYDYYSDLLNFKTDEEKLIVYENSDFEEIGKILRPNNEYYIYLPSDFRSSPKIPGLLEALKAAPIKDFELKTINGHSFIIKISS